jgi:mRNA-degrading endonuclease YafQ of YafQ-DinJ toxin-antitoxin module
MKLITENPKHPSLHTHKTNVRIQKEKAFSSKVTGEHRLIWKWSKKQKDTILLIDFGTHKEVYL